MNKLALFVGAVRSLNAAAAVEIFDGETPLMWGLRSRYVCKRDGIKRMVAIDGESCKYETCGGLEISISDDEVLIRLPWETAATDRDIGLTLAAYSLYRAFQDGGTVGQAIGLARAFGEDVAKDYMTTARGMAAISIGPNRKLMNREDAEMRTRRILSLHTDDY